MRQRRRRMHPLSCAQRIGSSKCASPGTAASLDRRLRTPGGALGLGVLHRPEGPPALPVLRPSRWRFPDPATAGSDGLVGIGADLEPTTLVDAYRRGIFPWPHPGAPLPWFSPDPRGVIPLDGLVVSRSLRARLRRSGWETTVDRAFAAVLAGCADRPRAIREGGTWITPPMRAAYLHLHDLGHAHSLEVWAGGELVGLSLIHI